MIRVVSVAVDKPPRSLWSMSVDWRQSLRLFRRLHLGFPFLSRQADKQQD